MLPYALLMLLFAFVFGRSVRLREGHGSKTLPALLGDHDIGYLQKRVDPILELCTGTNYGGTCNNSSLVLNSCLLINPEFSQLGSSRSSEGFICFVFRNSNCSGCEACVDAGGFSDMSTFSSVQSMKCIVPNALACTDALCANRGTLTSSASTPQTTDSSSSSSSTSPPAQTQASSKANVPAIAGGVVGGIIAVGAFTSLVVYLVRRRESSREQWDAPTSYHQEDPTLGPHTSQYTIEPYVSPTIGVPWSAIPEKSARSPVESPSSPAASTSPPSISTYSPSQSSTQRSDLEDRIRFLEQRLATMENPPKRRQTGLPARPGPSSDSAAEQVIQNLRAEIDGLRQQQRSLMAELRGVPPAYGDQ